MGVHPFFKPAGVAALARLDRPEQQKNQKYTDQQNHHGKFLLFPLL
jgi:hypothetical protein